MKIVAVALVLATAPVLAQERTPVSSITDATWQEYRAEYQQGPICNKDEITLWSCQTGKRVYALCSSQTMTRTSGYMQYRASNHNKVVFVYPAEKRPPLGSFVYHSFGNGDASVEFASNGYGYTLVDPLRGGSFVRVSKPARSAKESEIRCAANGTLQLNYTMRLMYDSGVWAGN